MNGPQAPGTVQVVLTGAAPDLINAVLFIDRVTAGDSPAEVLRTLGLNAIRTKSESGRNHRVTLVLPWPPRSLRCTPQRTPSRSTRR